MSQSENDIRRRKSGNANKKHQQEITNGYSSHHDAKVEEQKTILPEKTTEKEQNNLPRNETLSPSSSQMDDDPQSFTLVKQRNKNRLFNPPPISNGHSPGNYRDYHFKSNGQSSSSYPMCTYAPHNPLPPRFRQQQQQEPPPPKETVFSNSRFQRRRRGGGGGRFPKRSSYPPDFMTYSNDFVPTSEEHEQIQEEIDNQENQSPTDSTEQQDHPTTNGYSSESDIQTDSPSTTEKTSISPNLSTSTGSPSSSDQRLDLVRSLATSHGLLDELISIFDTTSFSSDEVDIILDKIASKRILNPQDLQRLKATTKNEKIFERIRDETYRSQAKILAIELQAEKTRLLELTKSNAEMENTIRQLQQQQPMPNAMFNYQQMIVNYQVHLRRLAQENHRLQHQLNGYAMVPAALNELKQQEQGLHEQIRQMSIRTVALENEVAESERASKHAAEIYKKADSQKQERIEQMMSDMNKYKKMEKELTTARQKYAELEKNFETKLAERTKERDDYQSQCDELKAKLHQYEQTSTETEEKIHQLKSENNQIRQSNWKAMEDVNKLSNSRSKNVSSQSS